MNYRYIKNILLIFLFFLHFTTRILFAGDVERLVSEGNKYFQDEKYDSALEAYEKASIDIPESPKIYFNKGNVFYMKGDYKKAIEFFEKAAIKSKDFSLEAKSYFNMGNSEFRESQRQKDSDLKKSINSLEKVVKFYQRALKINPDFNDASHNIEVARLLMKQIMDEIKKQQEKEKEEQKKQQEFVERIKKLIEQQEIVLEKTVLLDKEIKNQNSSIDRKGRSIELSGYQEEIIKGTDQVIKEVTVPPGSKEPENDLKKKIKAHLENSIESQFGAKDALEKIFLEEAELSEEKSKDELINALKAMTEKQANDKQQEQQNKEKQKEEEQNNEKNQSEDGQQNEEQEKKSKNQKEQEKSKQDEGKDESKKPEDSVVRDEDAHDILKEEQKNHERRTSKRRGGGAAVERDW